MSRLCWFGFSLLISTIATCSDPGFQILQISCLPNPLTIPYPSGAAVCLCKDQTDAKILVVIQAIKERKILPEFLKLNPGDTPEGMLKPWAERPAEWKAMAVANDFAHEYDLKIYFLDNKTN